MDILCTNINSTETVIKYLLLLLLYISSKVDICLRSIHIKYKLGNVIYNVSTLAIQS